MDPDLFILQTAPYIIRTGECPAGHIHVVGGFVSEVPLGDEERELGDYSINGVTGEIMRHVSDLAFSLN